MTDQSAITPRPKRAAPWKGRKRTQTPRTILTAVRLQAIERATIEKRASAAHMTISDYMRQASLGRGGPRAKRKPPAEVRLLVQILAERNKRGSNLNQMAKYANTTGDMPALRLLHQMLAEIKADRRDLLKALGRDH